MVDVHVVTHDGDLTVHEPQTDGCVRAPLATLLAHVHDDFLAVDSAETQSPRPRDATIVVEVAGPREIDLDTSDELET